MYVCTNQEGVENTENSVCKSVLKHANQATEFIGGGKTENKSTTLFEASFKLIASCAAQICMLAVAPSSWRQMPKLAYVLTSFHVASSQPLT